MDNFPLPTSNDTIYSSTINILDRKITNLFLLNLVILNFNGPISRVDLRKISWSNSSNRSSSSHSCYTTKEICNLCQLQTNVTSVDHWEKWGRELKFTWTLPSSVSLQSSRCVVPGTDCAICLGLAQLHQHLSHGEEEELGVTWTRAGCMGLSDWQCPQKHRPFDMLLWHARRWAGSFCMPGWWWILNTQAPSSPGATTHIPLRSAPAELMAQSKYSTKCQNKSYN